MAGNAADMLVFNADFIGDGFLFVKAKYTGITF